MQMVKIVYWEDAGIWIGYLQEYPDCWTQGETLNDLTEHLRARKIIIVTLQQFDA